MLNVVLGSRIEGTNKVTVVDRFSAQLLATVDAKDCLVFEPDIVDNSLKQEIRDLLSIFSIKIA